jgi:hypothetical protein
MLKWRNLRVFLAGTVCGAVFVIAVQSAQSWFEYRSPQDAALYDSCLVKLDGNTVACDAYLRMMHRSSGQ